MTTVLAAYARRGCVGTCDARCYGALQPSQLKEPRRNACLCICGGAFHGMGLNYVVKAAAAGRKVGQRPEDLEAFKRDRGIEGEELVIIDRVRVRSLSQARRLARMLLEAPPIAPGTDLFACEEVA